MSEPLLHVLIINWNGREHLRACFSSLLKNDCGNVEYVLVDNGSEDDSVGFVRETYGSDPRVAVLELERNRGWSGGNNAGIVRALDAGAKYIFLLNNDTWTAPDALRLLVERAEEDPELGALAPKMVMYNNPAIVNSIGLECTLTGASWDRGIGRLDGPAWDAVAAVAGVCGGAFLLRAEAVRRAGLLPEEFTIYLDDLDLCLRIWDAGYRVETCPCAVVRHKFSATLGSGPAARRKYYLNTRNRIWLILRNYPASKLPLTMTVYVIGELRAVGRALLDGEPWRAWAHLRARVAAWLYLPRAFSERARRRRAGLESGRFWPYVRTDRMFCPRIEFPERGWYPERRIQGRWLRPMSRHAFEDIAGGGLRILHANPYPRLGLTEIRVTHEGSQVALLSTRDLSDTVLRLPAGRLEFEALRIFDADSTGETADFGGWIALENV